MKKRWFCALTAALLLLFPLGVSAADTGYEIRSMDLNFQVRSDGAVKISEQLNPYFFEPSHGIWRLIPLYYEMDWGDGKGQRTYRLSISDMTVTGSPYYAEKNRYAFSVRLGDANKTVAGLVSYGLRYTMSTVDPGLEGGQLFYYNLVGTDWDCAVEQVDFRVEMPADFDAGQMKIYIGSQGITQTLTRDKDYTVEGRVISGRVPRVLSAGEGVTLWLPLPEGYFDYPVPPDYGLMAGVLSLLLAGASILCFVLFGRDGPVVQVVEFESPEGMSSAELGYVIDGKVNTRDVVSLVIYWASIGCITIDELPGGKHFEFRKLKELPRGSNPGEVAMFAAFFGGRDKTSTERLSQKFYSEIVAAQSSIKQGVHLHGRIFALNASVLKALFRLGAVLPAALAGYLWMLPLSASPAEPLVFAGILTLLAAAFSTVAISLLEGWRLQKALRRMGLALAAAALGVLTLAALAGCAALTEVSVIWAAAGFLSILAVSASAAFMDKRTPRGLDLYGRVLGFREFMMTAEKDRIEALVHEDPQYFYKILPYAYALEVTDAWSKRFASIALPPPAWNGGGTHRYDHACSYFCICPCSTALCARSPPPC